MQYLDHPLVGTRMRIVDGLLSGLCGTAAWLEPTDRIAIALGLSGAYVVVNVAAVEVEPNAPHETYRSCG
jgi:hypothetical protein